MQLSVQPALTSNIWRRHSLDILTGQISNVLILRWQQQLYAQHDNEQVKQLIIPQTKSKCAKLKGIQVVQLDFQLQFSRIYEKIFCQLVQKVNKIPPLLLNYIIFVVLIKYRDINNRANHCINHC